MIRMRTSCPIFQRQMLQGLLMRCEARPTLTYDHYSYQGQRSPELDLDALKLLMRTDSRNRWSTRPEMRALYGARNYAMDCHVSVRELEE